MTNPILITGASGYVGQAIFQEAARAGYPVVGAYHRQQLARPGGVWMPLDLRDAAGVARLITELRPAAIVHAGAAWATPDEAQATIVDGTRTVAAAASQIGARLVHLSTDVLFDGEHAPYRESDPPAPITFYGAAKAAAEGIVAAHPNHVIVRTSLVTCFDPPDRSTAMVLRALGEPVREPTSECENMSEGERALARERPFAPARPVTLFTDEYRSPVRTEDLAAALVELIDHDYRGVLHVAGPERLSRYELGLRIATYHGRDPSPGIIPGIVAESGLIRPRDCALDSGRARHILSTPLRPLPVHG
ncbi:MAG: SDR family oxidoreductase [Anaerolineae bacterium]|nr:SDR family oxidoreductase [Anaerolineae bacterium]